MGPYSVPARKRPRGRPRGGDSDASARIIAAAIEEFGAEGYDAATMRGIAARAGVDPSLLHHYFGTKAELFSATVDAPMRPDVDVPALLDGPRDEMGARIVRYILGVWEQPAERKRGVLLVRAAVGNRLTTPLLAAFLSREVLGRLTAALDVPDADLRAALVASQIAGLLIGRYILELPPLVGASVEQLVERIGPTLQRYLTG